MVSKFKPKVFIFGSVNPTIYGRSWIEQSIPRIENAGWLPVPFDNLNYALEEFDESFSALATSAIRIPNENSTTKHSLLQRSDKLKTIPRAVILLQIDLANSAEFVRANSQDIVIPGIFPDHVPEPLANWLVSLAQES